jgi:hypothetical protein
LVEIKGGLRLNGMTQLFCPAECQTAHSFFSVLHGNLKDAFFLRSGCAAESHRAACLILQADRYFLESMCQAGRLTWARAFKRTDRWANSAQLFFEIIAWQHVALMGLTADDGFDAGLPAP